ncbi:MAG: methylthioribose-phosphate isomerase [Candidatus Sumerlaeota bacterium]|nr:methylthioribose-phosphate isomerase [Candidatus Sumerlaeota bacterium]
MTSFKTIEWKGRTVRLLDQTLLPGRIKYLTISDEKQMWGAIRRLSVRGAPAIGVAAAYGVYLGTARRNPRTLAAVRRTAEKVATYLATSRPTAVNLFWALEECRATLAALPGETTAREALAVLLARARAIHEDDERRCAAIARHGAPLLKKAKGVLTHCNAGALATAGVGTALGVIIEAARTEKFVVYADETRPLLQGARLTAWELKQAGVEHRLITDSMAATAMQRGLVQAVVTGADRIAANGDSANKIGTMPLAICARHFKVPFYIAAPLSTVDFSLKSGDQIPIEERADEEITELYGHPIAPKGTKTFNPAFDVVPARLIAAIITEMGVVRAPFGKGLKDARKRAQ